MEHAVRESSILPHGITLISEHTPAFKSASLAVAVTVGSVQEDEQHAGIAHLLEHLIFRGSEGQTSAALHAEFAKLGGRINGYTNEERTAFTADVLSEDLPEALDIFAQMLRNPALRDVDIELEKQIVNEESCRGCFNCTMREAAYGTAYPDHPIRRPIIGYEDSLAGLTHADLRAFHQRYYVGSNMVVAVASSWTHDQLVEFVNGVFDGLAPGVRAPYPLVTYEGGDLLLGTGSDQATLRVMFDVQGFSLDEQRALALFADVLGGHATSLLMEELREKRGLVYGVWADKEITAGADNLDFCFNGTAKNIAEICEVGLTTIRQAAFSLEESQLEAAKRRQYVGYWMAEDNLSRRVDDMITDITELGRITNVEERFNAYQSLTLEQVRSAGQRLLDLTPTLILSAPLRNAPKFDVIRGWLKGQASGQTGFFQKVG